MSEARNRIPNWLREGAVIVGSILLAFGIDARWELAREQAEVEALLQNLQADFAVTVSEAERVVANHRGGLQAAERLIAMAEAGVLTESDAAVVDRQLSVIRVSGASFDPPLGAVAALLQSGRLSQIPDPTLAAMLTSWPADVDDLKQQETGLGPILGNLDTYLIEAGVRTEWLIASDHVGAGFGDLPWERRPTRSWSELENPALRSGLANIWLGLAFTVKAAEQRLDRAREILEKLEQR